MIGESADAIPVAGFPLMSNRDPVFVMKKRFLFSGITAAAVSGVCALSLAAPEEKEEFSGVDPSVLPGSIEEARVRARILHETVEGALQVMHRDFFTGEEDLNLPSQALEDVFKELVLGWGVKIRWLGVNAKVMDKDHLAQDRFEERAVEVIDSGEKEYELVNEAYYRRAGRIRLQNECLKCHVPHRKSLEDRSAALVIAMPVRTAS
jgi:hypothetical protein